MPSAAETRDSAGDPLDLFVIGGGINGVGIARDAVGRGLSVALAEKDDLGGATSSWSTKLIHGGLRYLEHYDFRLVREALQEREILYANAPHIIHPLRFVLPHRRDMRPTWMIRAGLFLYDHLARRKHFPGSRALDLTRDPRGRPLRDTIEAGFEYADGWADDTRLVVLNAVDARIRGATIHVRTEVVDAQRESRHWRIRLRGRDGGEWTVHARALVNAGGPWVDRIMHTALHQNTPSKTRLVKGSHIVVPSLHDGPEAYILQNADKRVVFVIPYEGDYSLIGTTDVPVEELAEVPRIDDQEIQYLCDTVNAYFTRQIGKDDIVWTYSGIRPLFDNKATSASAVTRDYVFDLTGGGDSPVLLSVYGGKLTTYRRLAEHAVERLAPYLPRRGLPWTRDAVLPGGDFEPGTLDTLTHALQRDYAWLPDALARRYARSYGTRAWWLLGEADSLDDLGQHFGASFHEREAVYLIDHEFARDADDLLWRRTKQGLHMTPAERERVAGWMRPAAAA